MASRACRTISSVLAFLAGKEAESAVSDSEADGARAAAS